MSGDKLVRLLSALLFLWLSVDCAVAQSDWTGSGTVLDAHGGDLPRFGYYEANNYAVHTPYGGFYYNPYYGNGLYG